MSKKQIKESSPISTDAKPTHAESARYKYLRWYKLDNSAHLFPVIAGERLTNTYRISAVLTEEIKPALLQAALDNLLPKFDPFDVRLRHGFFWYYFEENGRKAPTVREEFTYPCAYIKAKLNRDYLFRVTYYKTRINIEVFHALTDGMGGINFLKELVYHYLRLAHPELQSITDDGLTCGTSMNLEDSFLRNYRKPSKALYATKRAFMIKGEHLRDHQLGIITAYMPLDELKAAAHKYNLSVNEYLVGTYVYSIYQTCINGNISKQPIRVAVPVNLRKYFDSVTTKNFFAMISAEFVTQREDYSYEEVLQTVKESLASQIDKKHLKEIFSYNVSNQTNIFLRLLPLVIKNIAMRVVYTRSALANTSTMTNIGKIDVDEIYKPYVSGFFAMLAMSKGQSIKSTICSYENITSVTFSSLFRDTAIQHSFIQRLVADNINVSIETNGVYNG